MTRQQKWQTDKCDASRCVGCGRQSQFAFTLIELLVVIAIIAILAAILMPVLSKAKVRAQTVYCMNNFKQLQLCYIMYLHDNNDYLPPNGGQANTGAAGSWEGQSSAQTDYSTAHIQTGMLWQYNQSYGIYVCPANTYMIKCPGVVTPPFHPGQLVPQTRTCAIDNSLNEIAGAGATTFGTSQGGVYFRWRANQLTGAGSPGVAQKIVFVDDNELQVSGGAFGIYGTGDPTHTGNTSTGNPPGDWGNVPGSRHNNGCVFSFFDGHVESWHWRGYVYYNTNSTTQAADAMSTMYDLPRIMACQFTYNSQPH